eukprot:SAG31_NODE_206_length_20335_cov_17.910160_16_plen_48_part_00
MYTEIREMWQQLPSNLNDLRETIRTEQAKADSLVRIAVVSSIEHNDC